MINLADFDSQRAILDQPIDAELKKLIRQCLELAYTNGLADLTHILIAQPGDIEAELIEALGWSPLNGRIDGVRGQLDADVIAEHPSWYQLTFTIGNSGFAVVLFVSREEGTLPELQKGCRRSRRNLIRLLRRHPAPK